MNPNASMYLYLSKRSPTVNRVTRQPCHLCIDDAITSFDRLEIDQGNMAREKSKHLLD